MNEPGPADQPARDRIRTELGSTFFVQAGAGTGKTTSLVSRVVALVRNGVPIGRVAAITFTEMAAAELVDRVREQLAREAEAVSAHSVERERLARALTDLDAAPVQTIHAFARRILATFPLEAGLPPRFDVSDEISARLAFDERWEAFLDDFLSEAGGPLAPLEFLYAMGLRTVMLRSPARVLHENWDRIDPGAPAPSLLPFDEAPLLSLARQLEDLLDGCLDGTDRLASVLREIAGRFAGLEARPSLVTRLDLWKRPWSPGNYGRRDAWQRPITDVREHVKDLDERRQAVLEDYAGRCLNVVLHSIARFVLDYAAERRTGGRLEYHDLLVHARDLLRASKEARETLHRRFPYILIDEFQDTDPLQAEITALIARDPGVDPGVPWDAVAPPPGSAFVVGDPRQSIYRFRRADVALYERARSALGGERLALVHNFRSLPPILVWVNHVFSRLMQPGDDAGQASFESLAWDPSNPMEAAGVFHVGGDATFTSAGEASTAEAAAIVAVVQDLCARRVLVREGDGLRPIRRSDITVLFRTRGPVPALEIAFEDAAVPYRVESRSYIYGTPEAVELFAILTTLADPSDEVALVAALRGPAFACSDADLFHFKAEGGRWDYLRPGLVTEGPVAEALQWLREQHTLALLSPVNVTLDRVLAGRGLFESAAALRRPRQRWQRYRFLLEQARAFAAGPGGDLRQFVSWLKAQHDAEAMAIETAAPETDDDAVRFLTIHAAKGLEFPVVILAGLASAGSRERPSLLFTPGGYEAALGPESAGIHTPGYDAARERDRQLDEYETVRALYVAATRARDILVVSLYRSEHQERGMLASLLSACPSRDLTAWQPYPFTAGQQPLVVDATTVSAHSPGEDAFDAWRARRERQLARLAAGNAIAATALAHLDPGFDPPETRTPADESRPWRRGRAGTSIGRAVHAVLQVVDLATGAGLDAAAHVQALAEGVPGREREIGALARAALASSAVRDALASGRWWREVFVSAPLEDRLLEGFIDLLFEQGDGLVVVDYKTDALRTDADADAAVGRYRLQVAAYALALEANLGRPVRECRLLFLSGGRALERTIDDLPAACEGVRTALRAAAPAVS